MKEILAVIAAVFAIAGNVPYAVDVVKKRVQPHAYTWFIWTLVSAIVLFGQIQKGAGVGALPTAASGVFTLLIFLLSLKEGFKRITRLDTFFLIFALIGIIPWALTDDPTISVVIAVSIDLIAFVPTLRKTWREPKTEMPILYGMNVIRHILALFSLETYNVATVLHSIAMLVTNTAMTVLILTPNPKKESET